MPEDAAYAKMKACNSVHIKLKLRKKDGSRRYAGLAQINCLFYPFYNP
jgi:hypothetical protein